MKRKPSYKSIAQPARVAVIEPDGSVTYLVDGQVTDPFEESPNIITNREMIESGALECITAYLAHIPNLRIKSDAPRYYFDETSNKFIPCEVSQSTEKNL